MFGLNITIPKIRSSWYSFFRGISIFYHTSEQLAVFRSPKNCIFVGTNFHWWYFKTFLESFKQYVAIVFYSTNFHNSVWKAHQLTKIECRKYWLKSKNKNINTRSLWIWRRWIQQIDNKRGKIGKWKFYIFKTKHEFNTKYLYIILENTRIIRFDGID